MAAPYRISIGVNIDAAGAKSGAASAQQAVSGIGFAAEKARPKIEQMADATEKLDRAATDGAAAAGFAAIGNEAAKAESKVQQLINAAVGLNRLANDNSRRWTGLFGDDSMSPERLRAKYSPLFAVIQQYKAAQVEIRTAHAMGALSADEMTAALSRQRQAALASIDAIKGRNAAIEDTPRIGGSSIGSFQTANIAAQFQDIAVTSAMGMSPLQIALQQGTQLSMVFEQMKASGQSAGAALLGAFTSIISPLSLVTIGIVAAGAAAIQYFNSVSDKTLTTAQAIEKHAETIRAIKQAYGEAAAGLGDYVRQSQAEMEAAARANLRIQQDAAKEAASTFSLTLGQLAARTGGASDIKTKYQPFADAIRDLRKSIRDGEPDFVAFRKAVDEAVGADPAGLAKIGDELINNSSAAADAQRRVTEAGKAIEVIGGKASSQVEGVAALTKALNDLAGIAVPALSDTDRALQAYRNAINSAQGAEDRASARAAYEAARQRISDGNPFVINSDGNQTTVPTPDIKPSLLGEQLERPSRAATGAANAYRDLVKAADDRVQQMKLEAQLAGESGIAADTLRFKLDLLQQSEDKGRSLTQQQVEAINARVAAFKQYAEEAAKATLKADLLFEREQLGRSAFDQQIAAGLRGAGLPIDFDSYEAGLIRTNLQLEYARDLTGDFAGTLASSLRQGKNLWESLGDAGVSALERIADTLLNDVLNSLFQVQGAGGSGGSILGSLFGGIFGGGSSFFPAAPKLGIMDAFSRGGYTGPGGVREPAGVVHRGEVVWSQLDVARAGGVATVEAMRLGRRGYEYGGAVGVQPLMPSSRASAMAASAGAVNTLLLKLSVEPGSTEALRPIIKDVVAQDAPGFAVQVVEDYDARVLPDRVAAINDQPRLR